MEQVTNYGGVVSPTGEREAARAEGSAASKAALVVLEAKIRNFVRTLVASELDRDRLKVELAAARAETAALQQLLDGKAAECVALGIDRDRVLAESDATIANLRAEFNQRTAVPAANAAGLMPQIEPFDGWATSGKQKSDMAMPAPSAPARVLTLRGAKSSWPATVAVKAESASSKKSKKGEAKLGRARRAAPSKKA